MERAPAGAPEPSARGTEARIRVFRVHSESLPLSDARLPARCYLLEALPGIGVLVCQGSLHLGPFSSFTFSSSRMAPSTAPSPQFDSPDFNSEADDTFPSARLPLSQPVADIEEAIHTLEGYPPAELRRARKHHRRALKALRDNAYNALSGDTRNGSSSDFARTSGS